MELNSNGQGRCGLDNSLGAWKGLMAKSWVKQPWSYPQGQRICIVHWTLIKDFLPSSLSCKSHLDFFDCFFIIVICFISFPFCLLDECSFHLLNYRFSMDFYVLPTVQETLARVLHLW